MLRDKHNTLKLSAIEKDIDAAIQRVQDAYGTDLSAFFKKVQRETQTPRPAPADSAEPSSKSREAPRQ